MQLSTPLRQDPLACHMGQLWSKLGAGQFMNLQKHIHGFTKKYGRDLRFGTLFSGCELFSCVATASVNA